MSGNGIGPSVSFSPNTLNFGEQDLGNPTSLPLTLTNAGSAPLVISGESIIDDNIDFAQSNNCTASLPPGGQCSFTVTFMPVTTGPLSARLSVVDNAAGSPHRVSFTGSGRHVFLSPTAAAFAGQVTGTTSAAQLFTLSNISSNPLSNIQIGFKPGTGSFAQTNNCGTSLASNSNCTINVTFAPLAAGLISDVLTVTDNAPNSPQTASLSGTGLLPQPVVSGLIPATVTAGSTNFTLTLNGSNFVAGAQVLVNGVPRNATVVGLSQLTAPISSTEVFAAGQLSIIVTVPFGSAASSPAQLTVINTQLIPLIGNLSPGRVQIGNPTFKLIVNGSFFASDSVVQIAGSGRPTKFISANQLTATILSTDLTSPALPLISVASATAGPSATAVTLPIFRYGDLNFDNTYTVSDLVILGNVIAGNITLDPAPADVLLNGTVDTQDLITLANFLAGNIHSLPVIPSNGALLNAGAHVNFSPPTFAGQPVGTTSDPLPLTLKDSGPNPVSITNLSISPSGEFAATTGSDCGAPLANPSCTINVTFTPSGTGPRSATLTILDNAGNTQTANLSGLGIGGAAPPTTTSSTPPTATLSIGPIASDSLGLTFTSQTMGTDSAPQSVTLTNQGPTTLTISGINITPGTDFSESNSCGGSLAPHSSCTISVTFSPSAAGTRTATLTVTSNAGNSPQNVSLSGTGS